MMKVLTQNTKGPAKATIAERKIDIFSIKLGNLETCGSKNCPS